MVSTANAKLYLDNEYHFFPWIGIGLQKRNTDLHKSGKPVPSRESRKLASSLLQNPAPRLQSGGGQQVQICPIYSKHHHPYLRSPRVGTSGFHNSIAEVYKQCRLSRTVLTPATKFPRLKFQNFNLTKFSRHFFQPRFFFSLIYFVSPVAFFQPSPSPPGRSPSRCRGTTSGRGSRGCTWPAW